MKFHHTTIEKLITIFEINSGWQEQKRLREALIKLDLSVYTQQNGNEVLVSTKELIKEKKHMNQNRE